MNEPTTRIQRCADGKYRWSYEVNLWRNPSVLLDLLKAMTFASGYLLLVMALVLIINGDFTWKVIWMDLKVFFWIYLFLMFLSFIGYAISAKQNGGRHVILHVMDEETVVHRQMPKQVERAQVIAAISMITDPTSSGPAILAATHTPFVSRFNKVRKVKAIRRRHLIKVDELLTKNRIYVEDPEDYEFVLNFIKQRCPKIKTK